jgi:phosphoribosylanthranilate isomerase
MYVKVCGITDLEDALHAISVGVDVLGFNLVPESKRYVTPEAARAMIERVRGQVLCVAVVANLTPPAAGALARALGVHRLQLHGDEPPEQIQDLAPWAFKALRVATSADIEAAGAFPGHPLLLDAKVTGQLGGTGQCIDWPLVAPLARARALILAGGLTPENVEAAVSVVQPWGVDAASGVETASDPRRKDPDKVRRFAEGARRASQPSHRLAF